MGGGGSTHEQGSILADLKKQLTCPVCSNVCQGPPIYQCRDGAHLICSKCRANASSCPTCNGPFSEERLAFAENLCEKLPRCCKYENYGCTFPENFSQIVKEHEKTCKSARVPCKFQEFGCETVLQPTLMSDHESNCENSTVKCPISNCPIEFVIKNRLSDHLQDYHIKKAYQRRSLIIVCLFLSLVANVCLYFGEARRLSSGLHEWYRLVFTGINLYWLRTKYSYHQSILKGFLIFELLFISYNFSVVRFPITLLFLYMAREQI